jgi:hypothetical protein
MSIIKHTLEEIQEFYSTVNACEDGIVTSKELGFYALEIDDSIAAARAAGQTEIAVWLRNAKKTEAYVRFNGKEITMTDNYQVFNPLTGVHTAYEGEEAARTAMTEIANQLLATYKISLVQTITNENGDTAWVAAELTRPLTVV